MVGYLLKRGLVCLQNINSLYRRMDNPRCCYGVVQLAPCSCLCMFSATKDMEERKIHMQKPLFKALETLSLRKIGPHFLLYATEDIDAQYRR